ncbi:MAG: translocation/assembly module TamB domain-containing protein [Bernardetiaceae bacterium]|nr:translocation/assembly module TamB domain-containing protein [Bernardetiaceae bacterium]
MKDENKHKDKEKKKKSPLWLRFFRFKYRLVLLLISIVFLLAIALSTPKIQTYLLQQTAIWLSGKGDFEITIGTAEIDWFGELTLRQVSIRDKRTGDVMIYSDKTQAWFRFEALIGENIQIDSVALSRTYFNLIQDSSSSNIIDFIDWIDVLTTPKNPKIEDTNRHRPAFIIRRAHVEKSLFSFDQVDKDSLEAGLFNYNHFTLESLEGVVHDFWQRRDTIQLHAEQLSTIDKASGLHIKRLDTDFLYSSNAIILDKLYAKINESLLRNSIEMHYDSKADFADFNHKVRLSAHLDSSFIRMRELEKFSEALAQYRNEQGWISGQLQGTVSDFKVQKAQLIFRNSNIKGDFAFKNLPDLEALYMDLDVADAKTSADDLRAFLPPNIYPELRKLGNLRFVGNFKGGTYNFNTNGNFRTVLGNFQTNIRLNTRTEDYIGSVNLYDFNFGALIESTSLKRINMSGRIQGRGFNTLYAKFNTQATIKNVEIGGYTYQNITLNGDLSEQSFKGEVRIEDPNLEFDLTGDINLKDSLIQAKGGIFKADLKALGWTSYESDFRTYIDFDIQGFDIDEMQGQAHLFDGYFTFKGRGIDLDSLNIKLEKEQEHRALSLASNIIDAKVNGDFIFSKLITDIPTFINEYLLYFNNDSLQMSKYYTKKNQDKTDTATYSLSYSLKFHDINELSQVFIPDLYLATAQEIGGYDVRGYLVRTPDQMSVNFSAFIDTLSYKNFNAYNTDIWAYTQKRLDSLEVYANVAVLSESQKVGEHINTEDFIFNLDWDKQELKYDLFFKDYDSLVAITLRGNIDIADSLMHLSVEAPKLLIAGQKWSSHADIDIDIEGKNIYFINGIDMAGDKGRVKVAGEISDRKGKSLFLDIDSLDIAFESGTFDVSLQLDAEVEMSGVYDTMLIDGDLDMMNIVVNEVSIGDFHLESGWDNQSSELRISGYLNEIINEEDRRRTLDLEGAYHPEQEDSPLDLTADIKGLHLRTLEPLLSAITSDFEGRAYGKIQIKGKPDAPLLRGRAKVEGGRFKVDYLNTIYHFDDQIIFEENLIGLRKFELKDDRENIAVLKGGLYHDGFKDFLIDIKGDAKNFKVLDLPRAPQALYYGTAIATGNFSIFGTFSDIGIQVNAKSEQNTQIYIPLDGYEDISDKPYIYFLTPEDTMSSESLSALEREQELKKEEVRVRINLELEITPDAYAEIIFDKTVGDIIRGNGRGKLKMNIDTQDDFTMFGDIELVKGSYNFTFLNLINKEFRVVPGGRIRWKGNPYEAELDMKAQYEQVASLAPLVQGLDSATMQSAELRRRYPVMVILDLQGNLMTPDISFDIQIPEYPAVVVAAGNAISLETQVEAFKTRIQNDDQELNRQVFSLIVLQRLSAENTFQGIEQSAGGSVSELLSNQLSYWVSQVDENLEINLDLSGLDANALSNVQLRLSYSFLNGRIRVTREGGFTNVQNNADISSIAGDWTVEYLLNRDGTLRIKAYHKNTINAFNTALENNSTAGVGLLKVFNFDNIGELFSFLEKNNNNKEIILDNEILLEGD